ncbi:MAG: efflux RND transporter periplasmic adaptor subunit [Thermoflexales bacterium]|nr:efflux RND transporter periplasmic adaptor subunit [Thermoflexales bacterium]
MDKLRHATRITHHAVRITLGLFLWLTAACQSPAAAPTELRLTGVIEGTQVEVVAEVSARVMTIAADEGERVNAGEVVVTLDDAALAMQVKQAEAAVSVAQANLAQVKASARQEAIDAAQAALKQAAAERDGAHVMISNTQTIRDNPQELTAQIDAARAGVKLAAENIGVMQTRLAEARYWREFYDKDTDRRETLDKQIEIAQKNLEIAQAKQVGAQTQVNALTAMRSEPVALQAQVNAAHSGYSLTLANVNMAEAKLSELKAGAQLEDIALAEAQLQQAQAQLKLAQAYQSRATLTAPLTGLVAQRSAKVGEVIQPGSSLVSIVNLDVVDMTVYVPQSDLPRVRVGDTVKVVVDAYPTETFTGEITSIASQAQFTARDTQNKDDRASIVFAVKIHLVNADGRLKAGMTADAVVNLQ